MALDFTTHSAKMVLGNLGNQVSPIRYITVITLIGDIFLLSFCGIFMNN